MSTSTKLLDDIEDAEENLRNARTATFITSLVPAVGVISIALGAIGGLMGFFPEPAIYGCIMGGILATIFGAALVSVVVDDNLTPAKKWLKKARRAHRDHMLKETKV